MHEKVNKLMSQIPSDVDRLTDWIWKVAFVLLLPWLVYLTNQQRLITMQMLEQVSEIRLQMQSNRSELEYSMMEHQVDLRIQISGIKSQITNLEKNSM